MSKILAYVHYNEVDGIDWLDVVLERNAIVPETLSERWFEYPYADWEPSGIVFYSGQKHLSLAIILQNPLTYSTQVRRDEDPQKLLAELEQAL